MGIFLFMNKILLLLIILFSSLYSENIKWHSSYAKALNIAHKEQKNLMIFIASSKTKTSNIILGKYFKNEKYNKFLNENFVNVLITVEYKTSYPIELFYTNEFPSIFFASYKDESFLTHPIYGLKNQEDFLNTLYSLGYK